jgi:VanZ family protein
MGAFLVVLLLYGSLAPAKALPPLGESDKLWHAGTYFVVMAYFSQIYVPLRMRLVVAVALIALGVGIEFIQPYFNRQFDWHDAFANGVGVAGALLISLSPLGLILRHVDSRLQRFLR